MSEKMIIEFSGWVEAHPEETKFQYIGQDESVSQTITAQEWMKLPKQERENYILENLAKAIMYATEGDYGYINIEVE